jgi:hypothetical protein
MVVTQYSHRVAIDPRRDYLLAFVLDLRYVVSRYRALCGGNRFTMAVSLGTPVGLSVWSPVKEAERAGAEGSILTRIAR